jgi:fumarate reductase subunit D
MFLAGFLWGVIKIWSGADRMSKGDADGKMGIVAGIIIAGAAAIMATLFAIFGMSGGALTPQF